MVRKVKEGANQASSNPYVAAPVVHPFLLLRKIAVLARDLFVNLLCTQILRQSANRTELSGGTHREALRVIVCMCRIKAPSQKQNWRGS